MLSLIEQAGKDRIFCSPIFLNSFAKIDMEAHRAPREFCVKSLSTLVDSVDEEQLLSPVRDLRHYLSQNSFGFKAQKPVSLHQMFCQTYVEGSALLLPLGYHQISLQFDPWLYMLQD